MSSGVMTRQRAAAVAGKGDSDGEDAACSGQGSLAAGMRPGAGAKVSTAAAVASLGPGAPLELNDDAAFKALLVAPLLVWWAAVGAGVLLHEGLPHGVKKVYHVMDWFDAGVLRPAGPLVPFAVLALRAGAKAVAAHLDRAAHPGHYATSTATAQGRHRAAALALLPSLGTLVPTCAKLYAAIAVARLALYLGHVAALQGATLQGVHLVSDHIFLAASMLICLQVEMFCAASDALRLQRRLVALIKAGAAPDPDTGGLPPPAGLGEFGIAASLLAAMLLYLLTAADMFFTAKYFHDPRESALTALAALAVFQLPVLVWVRRARVNIGSGGSAARA